MTLTDTQRERVIADLEAALSLIRDQEDWARRVWARDSDGMSCEIDNPDAETFWGVEQRSDDAPGVGQRTRRLCAVESRSVTRVSPAAVRAAVVRRADEAPVNRVELGTATTTQVLLGADDAAPHFAMRRFRMEDGGGMPLHTNQVEHEQYVLRGRARIVLGDETVEVGADDVLLIPAGLPHSYEVIEAPFEFLCLVPNRPDRIDLVETSCDGPRGATGRPSPCSRVEQA